MEYFNKKRFESDLRAYCQRPTIAQMEAIVATYLMPVCRGFAESGQINFVASDPEDAIQVAAIKCWEKVLHFRRITSPKHDGSALAYFTQIAYHAMLSYERREAARSRKLVSLDA